VTEPVADEAAAVCAQLAASASPAVFCDAGPHAGAYRVKATLYLTAAELAYLARIANGGTYEG
jgi:hypothetical protein